MTKARPWLSLGVIALAIVGWSSVAYAKRDFPNPIQEFLIARAALRHYTPQLPYLVPCSVCHIKGNTGSSTAITPLALALRARGLTGDSQSVTTALTQLQTDDVDSDGDGTSDIDELQAGTDPNSSANASIVNDQEPGYGCGGTAPTGKGEPGAGAAVALAWLLLRRRRGRP